MAKSKIFGGLPTHSCYANLELSLASSVSWREVVSDHSSRVTIIISPSVSETDVIPPKNITLVETSPSKARLAWTPSNTTWEGQIVHDVKVCVAYDSCAAGSSGRHCTTHQTPYSWLDFNSNVGTTYCVQVTACALCRDQLVSSEPAFKEIETPLYGEHFYFYFIYIFVSKEICIVAR